MPQPLTIMSLNIFWLIFILIIFRNKMVKIGLQIKAFLENVTDLEAEGEDFR